MKLLSLAILTALTAAEPNNWVTNWTEEVPDCEYRDKLCGAIGVCPEQYFCNVKANKCQKTWQLNFCFNECEPTSESILGGYEMVRDPSRYCKCIPDYQLEDMFCEQRPTGLSEDLDNNGRADSVDAIHNQFKKALEERAST